MKNLEKLTVLRLSAKKPSSVELWLMPSFLSVMSSFFHFIFFNCLFLLAGIFMLQLLHLSFLLGHSGLDFMYFL